MKQVTKRLLVASLSAAATWAVASSWCDAAGFRRPACCTRTIPKHDYQTGAAPHRATLASFAPRPETIEVTDPVAGTKRLKKVFEPLGSQLTVGDCTLTQLSLAIYDDGECVLTCRATNNAKSLDNVHANELVPSKDKTAKEKAAKTATPPPDTGIIVLPIRHHQCEVRVRFYSTTGAVDTKAIEQARGVNVGEFVGTPFYLAPEEQRVRSFSSRLPALRSHFNELTQAEFELEVDSGDLFGTGNAGGAIRR